MDLIAFPSGVTGKPARGGNPNGPQAFKIASRRFALLDELGIAGPLEAREHYQRALDLHAEARGPRDDDGATVNTNALIDQLASGEITPADATAQLAATAAVRSDARRLVSNAAERAIRKALAALSGPGEDYWLNELRGISEECIAKPKARDAERRWNLVHELADHVLATAHGAIRPSVPISEHRYRNPFAVHLWRLGNAKDVAVISTRVGVVSAAKIVEYRPIQPPDITLAVVAEHAEEWQPALLSADEVIATVKAIKPVPAETVALPVTDLIERNRRNRRIAAV